MRITFQNQMLHLAQTEAMSPALKALIGKSIAAEVIAVEDNKMLLDIEGALYKAIINDGEIFELGSKIRLNIDRSTEGVIYATQVKSDQPVNSDVKPSDVPILAKLGLERTHENLQIVDALLKQNVTPTYENVKLIKMNMLEAKVLVQDIPNKPIEHLLNEETLKAPLKDVVKAFIQVGENIITQAKSSDVLEKPQAEPVKQMLLDVSKELQASTNRTTLEDKPLSEAVVNVLSQVRPEHSAFLLSKKAPFSIENLLYTIAQTETTKTIGSAFRDIANIVKHADLPVDVVKHLVELLKDERVTLESLLRVVQNQIKDKSASEIIDKNVTFIKEASQVAPSYMESVLVASIPVHFSGDNQDVRLYMKKKHKKQEDAEDTFHILVALSTNHYDEVRCFIQKDKNHYQLDFSFENDDVKALFENTRLVLERWLAANKSLTFEMTFKTRTKESPIFENDIMPLDSVHHVDMKV